MYKHKTMISVLLLISLLCCLLSGCGKNEQARLSESGAMILNSVDSHEDASSTYRSKTLQLSDSVSFVGSIVLLDNEVIVYGEKDHALVLRDYDLNGNVQITYDLSWLEENQSVSAIAAKSSDCITLVVCTENDDSNHYSLYNAYADGRHGALADLEPQSNVYINGLSHVGDMLYLSYVNVDSNEYFIAQYTDMGGKSEQISIGKPFSMVSDGVSIYIGTNNTDGLHISSVDCESGELTEICAFDSGRLLAACDGKIYVGNSTDVFCYEIATGTITRLFQWTSVGVHSNGSFSLNSNGQYLVWFADVIRLIQEDSDDSAQRKEIVIAINGMPNEFSNIVIRFNDENDKYRLVVKDYSQYTDPMQTLATEMNAGSAPDIIDIMSFSSNIANENALEDLVEYFNADPDISTADLLEGPLNAMTTKNGKLLSIAPAFTIWSITGSKELVHSEHHTTVSERLGALGDPDSAFAGTLPRDTFLELAFCSQKTELYSQDDIASILEYAAKLPEEYNDSTGAEPLYLVSSYESFASWWFSRQYFGGNAGDMAIFGMPFFEGTGIIVPSCKLAIPKGSENKEGAWEFIKFMLLSEMGTSSSSAYCPLLKAEYERRVSEGYSAVENGGTINGEPIVDTSHISEFDELVNGVSGVYDSNSTTYTIVLTSAARFFAGQVTSQEAAADIMSRLSLYYSERK